MKNMASRVVVLAVCVIGVLLTACGGSSSVQFDGMPIASVKLETIGAPEGIYVDEIMMNGLIDRGAKKDPGGIAFTGKVTFLESALRFGKKVHNIGITIEM